MCLLLNGTIRKCERIEFAHKLLFAGVSIMCLSAKMGIVSEKEWHTFICEFIRV